MTVCNFFEIDLNAAMYLRMTDKYVIIIENVVYLSIYED